MTEPDYLSARNGDVVVIDAFVQPRAARTALAGIHGSSLKIKIGAPPVDDRANRALENFLARLVGVPPSQVLVVAGRSSRHKRIEISGADLASVKRALARN
jgi:uncharacterized protein (TIGR00251 family)